MSKFKTVLIGMALWVTVSAQCQVYNWTSTNSVGQTEAGVLVQVDPAVDNLTAFWGGFTVIFMAGMLATGARWVKKIVGGVHEAGE
jgi:hypothetical protein